MLRIEVVNDFTDTPGARYIKESDFSGEEFRIKILEPKFLEAKEKNEKLVIDFDGSYGYPTSFLEEAFGGLARLYNKGDILRILELVSEDEPAIIKEINGYIKNA